MGYEVIYTSDWQNLFRKNFEAITVEMKDFQTRAGDVRTTCSSKYL